MTQTMPSMDAYQRPSEGMADIPSLGMVTQHRLRRLGARPIVFSGSELAMAMSYTPQLPYWYEINVYRTDDQGFVLAIRQFFQSEDESDLVQAWSFETLAEVFDAVEAYDAGKDVRLPKETFSADAAPADLAASAMRLQAEVNAARLHYAGLVGEFFAEMDMPAGNF